MMHHPFAFSRRGSSGGLSAANAMLVAPEQGRSNKQSDKLTHNLFPFFQLFFGHMPC
jgi:hypothetical protein